LSVYAAMHDGCISSALGVVPSAQQTGVSAKPPALCAAQIVVQTRITVRMQNDIMYNQPAYL
jgi:hypothetical protein